MNNMLTFLWLASLLVSIFYAVHYFLLRREKAFWFNRLYLLAGLLLALLIPAAILTGSSLLPVSSAEPVAKLSRQIVALPAYTLSASEQMLPTFWSWKTVLLSLYLTGLSVAALRLLTKLIRLRTYLHRLRFRPIAGGYYLAEESGRHSSFSFFHYIIINPAEAGSAEEYQQILRHEKAHASQKHSLDVLLVESMMVVLWFLPTVYWLRNSLQEVHEYLADEEVMGRQLPDPTYIKLMARISLRAAGLPVTSPFNQFSTLNRIRMIQKTSKPNLLRLTGGLCLAAGLSFLIACQEEPEPQFQEDFPAEINLDEQASSDEKGVFEVVDDQPRPMPGMEGFFKTLGEELKYPASAKEAGIEGRVFIQFVVTTQGKLDNMQVVKGVNEALDAEAMRAFQALDVVWKPGKKDGKDVPTRMVMPISFKL